MVKFNIMDPPEVSVVRGHPSTKKTNFLRKVSFRAEHPSEPQAAARLALSQFASQNLYGRTGTMVMPDGRVISVGAYTVMVQYPHKGQGAFGGATNEQRASMRHELAAASIQKQQTRLESMRSGGRIGRGAGFPAIPM
ncbi:MAG: hypothetical protein PHZ02_01180 [Desulfocapsaceae bacterium]|nr:hypothetical protein [Desulfocapsaceae bacterium]